MSWQTLGAVPPTALVDARLELHYAAQVVASAGMTFLEPQPDDSHPNLGWVQRLGALLGRTLPGANLQVGLRVSDLTLLLVDASGSVRDELALHGRTLENAYDWLATVAAAAGAAVPPAGITRSAYEIPDHAIARGGPFDSASRDALAELARWFSNGYSALLKLTADIPGASEVRCWPHHFDVGSLVVVATQTDGSLAKSIGLGLSPGDESYAEPYWYVSPWPYPEADALPALASGEHWHTDGHTSAILTGSHLIEGPRERQEKRLRAFLETAVVTGRRILGD